MNGLLAQHNTKNDDVHTIEKKEEKYIAIPSFRRQNKRRSTMLRHEQKNIYSLSLVLSSSLMLSLLHRTQCVNWLFSLTCRLHYWVLEHCCCLLYLPSPTTKIGMRTYYTAFRLRVIRLKNTHTDKKREIFRKSIRFF